MAKEYIEREAVLEILRKKSTGTYRGMPCYPDEISTSFREVSKLPAADVVEVGMLRGMLSELENKCFGDGVETYTTGYRNGHRNGQIELLRYILRMPEGTSEDARMDGDG